MLDEPTAARPATAMNCGSLLSSRARAGDERSLTLGSSLTLAWRAKSPTTCLLTRHSPTRRPARARNPPQPRGRSISRARQLSRRGKSQTMGARANPWKAAPPWLRRCAVFVCNGAARAPTRWQFPRPEPLGYASGQFLFDALRNPALNGIPNAAAAMQASRWGVSSGLLRSGAGCVACVPRQLRNQRRARHPLAGIGAMLE